MAPERSAYGCVRQLAEPSVARGSGAERDRLFEAAAGLSQPLFAQTRALQLGDGSFSMLHGLRAVAVLGDGASLAEVAGPAGFAGEQVACAADALGVLSCAR